MRVALLSANARAGDAIGNQIAEKLAFFLDRQADVRVYVESTERLHPAVRRHCRRLDVQRPADDDWAFLTSADLVVAEFGHAYSMLGLLPLIGDGKPRIMIDYHGVTPPELWEPHNRDALTEAIRQRGLVWCADTALVHSRFTLGELVADSRFPSERVERIGCPVDSNFWTPGPPACDLREQLGTGSATLLLFVGRLAPNKRVPVLVEALARLTDVAPPVHAVLIGDTGDIYQHEANRCQARAAELGVADRLHILGQLSDQRLRDAYRSADVFVMPSRHEGFCIPVIEAMACGVPVVAARAAALMETVAGAGLTFIPDDAADLARQIRRVTHKTRQRERETGSLKSRASVSRCLRLAVVSFRYGTDFAGGAETSLRTIAETLHQAGHAVEVYSTCARGEANWENHYAAGTTHVAGIPVHRFRLDGGDPDRYRQALQAIVRAAGSIAEPVEEEFLAAAPRSDALLEALRQHSEEFDAIITGPYSNALSQAVALAIPEKTLLLPCFHDERLAYLKCWLTAFDAIGGMLYHTPEEQELGQSKIGLNHPRAACCGTYVSAEAPGDPERGRVTVGSTLPYVVYCGRYSEEKGLPPLLAAARAYADEHPRRFAFVFMGEGGCTIPDEPWARDLGFVDEATKRDVVAGATALVLLSEYESLSLAVLEAWAQGIPVIVQRRSPALVGHLTRGGGGRAVESTEELLEALDDLWQHPQQWQALGRQGRQYVTREYGSRPALASRLIEAVRQLRQPLAECMRRRGPEHVARFDRSVWRQRFAEIVENVLHAPIRTRHEQVEVTPRIADRTVTLGMSSILVPLRVTNWGTRAALVDGPARVVIRGTVCDTAGSACAEIPDTPLPGLLVPGQVLAAAVPVPVPSAAGSYRVAFHADRAQRPKGAQSLDADAMLLLRVESVRTAVAAGNCAPMLDLAQAAVAEAHRLQQLPTNYVDVTQGQLARLKRWIKRKILGNFKHAYVDVISRQQSAFNQHVLRALSELSDCCATLDHARSLSRPSVPSGLGEDEKNDTLAAMRLELAEKRRQLQELLAHLERLETVLQGETTREVA